MILYRQKTIAFLFFVGTGCAPVQHTHKQKTVSKEKLSHVFFMINYHDQSSIGSLESFGTGSSAVCGRGALVLSEGSISNWL